MAGIQPYRYPESIKAANNMALSLGMTYAEDTTATSNMASGERLQSRHPVASAQCSSNRVQPYGSVKMDYFYPQLQIGTTEPVVVTQVLDPHRLFCQLRSLSHEVQRLSESMHHYYQVQKGYVEEGMPPSLVLGQPCASCGTDRRWYRSLLQELFVNRQLAMVIHVDLGRRDIVPLTGLRTLAAEFFRMPVVTFPCTLYGISDGGLGWDPMHVNDLRAMLLGRQVSARIECYNSYEHLYVVTLFGEDGMDLNCAFGMRSQSPKACQFQMSSVTALPELPEDIVQKIPTKPSLKTSYISKFPPVELKTGKFEDAVVEFVIDPFNFWVRLQKYAACHKEMVAGLTALYSQASKLKGIIAKAKPGQLCCTKYQDLYYRAEVISVSDNKVNVYFLDNGVLGLVDWSEIRELPAEFTKLPALANKCSIADTYPLEQSWNQEAILAFRVAVTDKKLVIYVLSKDVDEYTIEVTDQSRIEEKCVGKILANAGLARFEELDAIRSQSSDRKIVCVETPVLNPNASDYAFQDPENTVSYSCEEASPFEQQLFEPGTTIEVVVSHVQHPGIFWCQNAASKGDLCSLMGAIQNHCMSTDCPYSAGSLACLAKSLRDEIWYRAFIIEIPVNLSKTSTVEVEYVDYGNRETVPVANLRALNNEFFNLKAQAFKCSLYNIIIPIGGNPFVWDDTATKVFLEFVQKASKWTEFHCIIYATASLDKELFNIVDLYTPFSRVCDTLVKSGYATHLHHTTLAPSVQLHTYYYSMHDIKLGNEEEVYITHVDSSLLFYAQLVRSSNTVDNISSTIKRVMENTRKIKFPPISGALCLAKFIDQQWYRGLIQSEDRSNKILFVDYGNTEEISKEDVVPIMPSEHDLLLVPMQAIKCFMSDIPSEVPEDIASWFEDAVLDKKLKAVIVEKDAVGKLSVELYDGDQQINATLKNKLGLRVKKDKCDHMPAGESKMVKRDDSRKVPEITTNRERRTSFSVGKNFKSRESDIRSQSDRDQESEPRYRKPTFQCKSENKDYSSRFQDSNSQRKTEAVRTDPPTQGSLGGHDAKLSSNKTLPQRQSSTFVPEHQSPAKPPVVMLTDIPKKKICPGVKEPVYVSHTNSIFDFYVHFADETQLDEMTEILNKEKSSFEVLGDEDINVGNVICAFFPDDGLYYRGVVTEKNRQGFCVEYVDYGNTSTLSDCKNYRLPEKCLHIPVMSIHCSLNKPKNASSDPNLQELLAEFSKRTSDLQLDCEFLRQDGLKWDVILKDKQGCINDLLTTSEEPALETDEPVMEMKEVKISFVSTFTWNLPEPATIIKVYASSTDGPECFWCQLATADIDSLASQVQKAGEESIKNDNFIDTLQIGSPCNVIFSEDRNWYRAMVTKMEADLVTVRFIDYGNEDVIKRDHIKQLPESLEKIPPQAFSCRLADFDTKAGTWTSEGRNYFYDKVNEDVLELTVCKIQESDLCLIPVACVTITYGNLNINEEMRKFWQEIQNMDLELSDEFGNLSPIDLLEEDHPHSHIDSPTTDQRSNDSGESASEGQCEEFTCSQGEDLPLQDLGEEQESETDVFEDSVDLHHEEHVDQALEDDEEEDKDVKDLGSDEVTRDMGDDLSPYSSTQDLEEQGSAIEWGCFDIGDYQQFPDVTYFHPQEVTTQSEIIEDILIPGGETAEELEECTEDGTKQQNDTKEGVYVPSEDYVEYEDVLTTNNDLAKSETPQISGIEEAAFSNVIVTSEVLYEITPGREVLAIGCVAAKDDLDNAGEAAPSTVTQEDETIETVEFADERVLLHREHIHSMEYIVTNEDVEETGDMVTIVVSEKSEAAMASEDVTEEDTNNKVSTEFSHKEGALVLQDKAIKESAVSHGGIVIYEDDIAMGLGDVDLLVIEDSQSVVTTEGEQGPASVSYTGIETVNAEDVSENEETVSGKVDTEHFGKDFVQNNEVVIHDDDVVYPQQTIVETDISFEEFEANFVEGLLIDLDQDFVASASEDPVVVENWELKDSMNLEEPVDLELKDSMNLEEPVDLELKDSLNLEKPVELELKDSMNLEEPVDLELKDGMNLEEPVDLELKDSMNLEEPVYLELKDNMSREEPLDLEFKNSRNHEEAADMESKNSMNHDEAVDINMNRVELVDLEPKDSMDCEKARDINMNLVEAVDLEPKYSKNCEEAVDINMNRVEPVDVELKHSRNCEEPVDISINPEEPTDLEHKYSMNFEEAVDISMNREELVDLKLKDSVKCEAAVDMGLKISMNREEDIDLELKDSMNHAEAVAGGDEFKDSINYEEAVVDNREVKNVINCKEAVTDEEKKLKDRMKHKEAEVVEEVVSFEELLICESMSTDFSGHEDPEIVQKCVEDESSQYEAEHLWTITSKDIVQKELDLPSCDIECGWVKSTVFGEVIKEDQEVASTEGAGEEDSLSFEEFEATIVEGPLGDLSHDFVASAGEGPEVGEKLELKYSMSHGEAVAKEDLEAEAFEEVFYGSLLVDDSNDHEEPDLVQGFVESSQDVVTCEFDVGDQSEDTDITDMRQQETEQQEPDDVAEDMEIDMWEPTAENDTAESNDNQPGSFTMYRESPALIASTDSVYESELNEPMEETDSDCGVSGPAGSTEDLLWTCFSKPEFAVEETEVHRRNITHHILSAYAEDDGNCTLLENICQTNDGDTKATDIGDHQDQAPESQIDISTSVEGELSPVTAEESGPEGKEP